jgi:hypothetical protein
MQQLIEAIFALSKDIRYVAIYNNGELSLSVKEGLIGASSSDSDKYEELIVNPALLTLVTQRGNIDCGGVRYVIIRYGNFYQFIAPLSDGHISISIEPQADPLKLVEPIQNEIMLHKI